MEIKEKQCTKCKEVKTLDLFKPNKRMSDGKSSWCKECHNKKDREYRIKTYKHKGMENRNSPRYKAKRQTTIDSARQNGILYLNDVETKEETRALWKCNVCNYEWEAYFSNIKKGHGCKPCSIKRRAKIRTKPYSHYHNKILKKCGDILEVLRFIPNGLCNSQHLVECKCKKCETINTAQINNLITGGFKHFKCKCKVSDGEYLVWSYLERNNTPHITEKSFDDLKDKKKLKYDFYINTSYPTLIEFDGDQHYIFNPDFFNMTKQKFAAMQRRDKMKNKYALDNNILLLRLRESDKPNIEQKLDENLYSGYMGMTI